MALRVLVTRPQMGKSLFKHLLVALDGSPFSWQAFQVGLQLAKVLGASLSAISVIEGSVAPPVDRASTTMTTSVSEGIHWNWTTYFQQVQARGILARIVQDQRDVVKLDDRVQALSKFLKESSKISVPHNGPRDLQEALILLSRKP